MPLVVSVQQRENGPAAAEGVPADYDWPFSVDRCEVVRDGAAVRVYFWSRGNKEVGPGLHIPASIAPQIGEAIAALSQSSANRLEIAVPAA